MADDLEALRLHLELPQICLLGHSNGGAISLIYAAKNPERVKKLILVGTEVRGFNSASDTQAILNLRSTDPRFAEAVRVATAFFAGEVNPANDFICPVAISERLHGTLPGSQLVIFEDSGHFPWLEEQEDFREQLDQFLSGGAEDWTDLTNCSDSAGAEGSKNPVSSTNPIGRL